jgi:hypothetical protein
MEIKFSLTPHELKEVVILAKVRVILHRPFLPFLFFLLYAVLPGIGLASLWYAGMIEETAFTAALATALYCVAGSFLVERFLQKQYLHYGFTAHGPLHKEHHVKLDDEGVVIIGSHSSCTWQWAAIKEVSEEKLFVVLWFDRAYGLPIPNRAFADDAARKAFAEQIRTRLSSLSGT